MEKGHAKAVLTMGIAVAFLLAGCENKSGGGAGNTDSYMGGELPADVSAGRNTSADRKEAAESLEREACPDFQKEDIRGISVAENGTIRYQLHYMPRPDRDSYLYWDIPVPYASAAVVDTEAMYELFDAVAALDFCAKETKDTGQAETGSFGTCITVNYYHGEEDSEQQAEPNRTMTLIIGDKKDGKYFCTLRGYEDRTFSLDETAIDTVLHKNTYDLLLKIPYVVNVATVKEVDIRYKGKEYTMTREGEACQINGSPKDRAEYMKLYSDLMQPMLDGQIPADARLETDREALVTIRYVRSLDGAEDYEVAVYPYGDGQYTVSVNGHEYFFLVPEDVRTLENVIREAFQ